MTNINSLNGATFNELETSELLTVGDGVTDNGDGTFTVTPDINGNLATYDIWSGFLGSPQPNDTVSFSFAAAPPSDNAPNGVVQYTFMHADGTVGPPSGTLGAAVIAWNGTEALLETFQGGYFPGEPFTGSGNYLVVGTQDLSTFDGTVAPGQTFTFGTTGAFPAFAALCFLSGTLIATPSGEAPVETLSEGDLVLTASGTARPIVWLGTGKVLATRGRRTAATPVIVRKGALAPNVPHQDLRVTKGHSFYIDNVLIPAEFLVNHRSILWDDHAQQEVTLYHIELETHDLLLANGATAESYRDDGNRWLFQNANSGWNQPPKPACAPVLTGGPIVDAVWRRLLDRAGSRPGLILTDESDLHLLVDGSRVDAEPSENGAYVFRLSVTHQFTAVRIVSRAAAPDELGLARDPRLLGVALHRMVVRQDGRSRTVDAADERLAEGFHVYEPEDGLRWTNGDATLPTDLFEDFFGHSVELELHLRGATCYIADVRNVQAA